MEMNETQFKLLIDNALLEQEKRLTTEYRREMTVQTDRFTSIVDKHNGNVIALTKAITQLEVKYDALKIRIWAVGGSCSVFGGLVGFFVAKIT